MGQVLADRARQAVAADRSRISDHLHDHLLQTIFAAGLQLTVLADRLGDDAARSEIRRAVALLDTGIEQLRVTFG